MTFAAFLKDKVLFLLLQIILMALLFFFLSVTGYPKANTVLILVCWILTVAIWLILKYRDRRRYFGRMEMILDEVDQRYLLGELMPASYHLEDQLYRDMIRKANKSMIERVRRSEDAGKGYREYIESWVHEIKAPITAVDLMCVNHKDELTDRIRKENRRIEDFVDMALYYAKSDEVYKDYMIRQVRISDIVSEVLSRDKQYLIGNGVHLDVDCQDEVYTDPKWIGFILHQSLQNAVKYRKGEHPYIKIFSEKKEGGVRLTVEDDGIGIREEELSRIFEKGFTGSNGRKIHASTGMGLYLSQKLCRKLGIRLYARSLPGEWTKLILEFPVSTYLSKL